MTEQMKDAMNGSGGGLQQISSGIGEAMASNSTAQSSDAKAGDKAGQDIGQMANTDAKTAPGTSKSGAEQMTNQSSGSADHLNLGK